MTNGRLEKPVYQLQMPLEGIEEAVLDERVTSEAALAALAALRVKEPNIIQGLDGKPVVLGEREVAPRWMELYKRLIEGGWKWRVAVYIAWAAQPKKDRWPLTQEELSITGRGLASDRAVLSAGGSGVSKLAQRAALQAAIIYD